MRQPIHTIKEFGKEELPLLREVLRESYRDSVQIELSVASIGAGASWADGAKAYAIVPEDTQLERGYIFCSGSTGSTWPRLSLWRFNNANDQISAEVELDEKGRLEAMTFITPTLNKGDILCLKARTAATTGAATDVKMVLLGRLGA